MRIGHGQFHHGPATQFGHLRPSAVSSRDVTPLQQRPRLGRRAEHARAPQAPVLLGATLLLGVVATNDDQVPVVVDPHEEPHEHQKAKPTHHRLPFRRGRRLQVAVPQVGRCEKAINSTSTTILGLGKPGHTRPETVKPGVRQTQCQSSDDQYGGTLEDASIAQQSHPTKFSTCDCHVSSIPGIVRWKNTTCGRTVAMAAMASAGSPPCWFRIRGARGALGASPAPRVVIRHEDTAAARRGTRNLYAVRRQQSVLDIGSAASLDWPVCPRPRELQISHVPRGHESGRRGSTGLKGL